jgi:radical SAM superfamily enzyme
VYKLPINLPLTCPNRDGTKGVGGCIFCSEIAAGFEAFPSQMAIKEQLERTKELITRKYKAKKFIAFFQNYTNTYMPTELFKEYVGECLIEGVVAVAISTRPDCIDNEKLIFLRNFHKKIMFK